MANTLLAAWQFEATHDSAVPVVPDGCRDLILKRPAGRRPFWFVTSVDDHAHRVAVACGDVFTGYRLRPGTSIDEPALLASLRDPDMAPEQVACRLESHTVLRDATADMMECLASGPNNVAAVAALLGLSRRTLQRAVLRETGLPPVYWLQLARVRRAGRAAAHAESLADVAFAHAFSDQAHMSREFRRWFGVTPSMLKKGCAESEQLRQSGFG